MKNPLFQKACSILFGISFLFRLEAEVNPPISIKHNGLERTYIIHIPTNYKADQPIPLVFIFHGGGDADEMQTRTKFDALGDIENFISVYPQAYVLPDDKKTKCLWADSRGTQADKEKIDDVGFTSFLIDEIIKMYSIDKTRVYATGLSAGGYFCQRLALQLNHRIAAFACVASSLTTSLMPFFPPSRKVPLLFMNGTNDSRNPYDGGPAGGAGIAINTEIAVAYWASYNECGSFPTSVLLKDNKTSDLSWITSITYNPCGDGSEVILYRIENGGHTWPGSSTNPPSLGTTNYDINADSVIWKFFQKHSLPGGIAIGPPDMVKWAISDYAGNNHGANSLQTLYYNKSGHSNTANGLMSLWNNTDGFDNTATGRASLFQNTLGSKNSAFGRSALFSNSIGAYNTACGFQALFSNTKGDNNTAIGYQALYKNDGSQNTANGYQALFSNDLGIDNTASGYQTLFYNKTGNYNSGSGYESIFSNVSGSYNTACGYHSLYYNQGSENTAVGFDALFHNVDGIGNIAIGYRCGINDQNDIKNNTVSIGNAGYLNNGSNKVFIGNRSIIWNGGNLPWSEYSDARIKRNIQEDVKGLDFIKRLRPVTYYRSIEAMSEITGDLETEDYPGKYDIEKIKFTGFLAQEVEQAARDADYNFSGITIPENSHELYSLSYEVFVVPLVKAVQELAAKNNELDDIIFHLKADNEGLAQRLEKLERMLVPNSKLTSTLSESQSTARAEE